MKLLLVGFLGLLITGCAQIKTGWPLELDQFMEEYFDVKYRYTGVAGPSQSFRIIFEDLGEGNLIGQCRTLLSTKTFPHIQRTIALDINFWQYADYFSRKELLWHELGHCDLNYGHPKNGLIMGKTHGYLFSRYDEEYLYGMFFHWGL